jgi:hypothetical protein
VREEFVVGAAGRDRSESAGLGPERFGFGDGDVLEIGLVARGVVEVVVRGLEVVH